MFSRNTALKEAPSRTTDVRLAAPGDVIQLPAGYPGNYSTPPKSVDLSVVIRSGMNAGRADLVFYSYEHPAYNPHATAFYERYAQKPFVVIAAGDGAPFSEASKNDWDNHHHFLYMLPVEDGKANLDGALILVSQSRQNGLLHTLPRDGERFIPFNVEKNRPDYLNGIPDNYLAALHEELASVKAAATAEAKKGMLPVLAAFDKAAKDLAVERGDEAYSQIAAGPGSLLSIHAFHAMRHAEWKKPLLPRIVRHQPAPQTAKAEV